MEVYSANIGRVKDCDTSVLTQHEEEDEEEEFFG